MTSRADRDCLAYNPFGGDRDTDARLLSDRMGIARKPGPCQICWEPIKPGERVRMRREVSREEGKAMTFRFCALCCAAMAKSWRDAGKAIERRTSMGMVKAGTLLLDALESTDGT